MHEKNVTMEIQLMVTDVMQHVGLNTVEMDIWIQMDQIIYHEPQTMNNVTTEIIQMEMDVVPLVLLNKN
jgi:hypothetical protein